MNPGAGDEAAKVANNFIDSLKGQPLLLAMAVMNLTLLALVFYIAMTAAENRRLNLASQQELAKLLVHCGVN